LTENIAGVVRLHHACDMELRHILCKVTAQQDEYEAAIRLRNQDFFIGREKEFLGIIRRKPTGGNNRALSDS